MKVKWSSLLIIYTTQQDYFFIHNQYTSDVCRFYRSEHVCYQPYKKRKFIWTWPTCLLWVKSRTLWSCFFHSLSSDSTTIIFPDLFQYPYSSVSALALSSALSFPTEPKIFGPPVDKSGWLQTLRRVMRPGNTCQHMTSQPVTVMSAHLQSQPFTVHSESRIISISWMFSDEPRWLAVFLHNRTCEHDWHMFIKERMSFLSPLSKHWRNTPNQCPCLIRPSSTDWLLHCYLYNDSPAPSDINSAWQQRSITYLGAE